MSLLESIFKDGLPYICEPEPEFDKRTDLEKENDSLKRKLKEEIAYNVAMKQIILNMILSNFDSEGNELTLKERITFMNRLAQDAYWGLNTTECFNRVWGVVNMLTMIVRNKSAGEYQSLAEDEIKRWNGVFRWKY